MGVRSGWDGLMVARRGGGRTHHLSRWSNEEAEKSMA